MKLVRDELNYFQEVGSILRLSEKLKEKGISLIFDDRGIRITTVYSKEVRGEYYYTAEELKAYLLGLEDGFWSAPVKPELFKTEE